LAVAQPPAGLLHSMVEGLMNESRLQQPTSGSWRELSQLST